MSIKQNGGVFGRNPTFNDLTIEGDLILNGEIFTGLDFQGSWNASTNSPSLASSTGTNGEFYIVSVAGTTNLNGITNWGIGDWAIFNGTVWQRVEGGADGNFDALNANSLVVTGTSYIQSATTPQLELAYNSGNITGFYRSGGDFQIKNDNGAGSPETSIVLAEDGAVTLYHDANPKIATTSGGCDITGSLSADGAILSGNLELNYAYPRIKLTDTDHNSDYSIINNNGEFGIFDDTNNGYRLNVSASGDVSIPNGNLNVSGSNVTNGCRVQFTNAAASKVYQVGAGQAGISNNGFVIRNVTDSTFPLVIDDNSNVSIPSGNLDVTGTATMDGLTVEGGNSGSNVDVASFTSATGALNINCSDLSAANPTWTLRSFSGEPIAFAQGTTEAMRIASDGSLSTPTAGTSNVRFGVNAGNSIQSGGSRNVLIGDEAGTAITTGDYNVALGYAALDAEDAGSRATALGYFALSNQNTDTDSYNVAVGFNTGKAITTGTNNTLIGGLAGDALTDGSANTTLGYDALGSEVRGNRAVAVGYAALSSQSFSSSTANYNVGIGFSAGASITTGVDNTLIGGLAGDAITDADYNVALGNSSLSANMLGSKNTAIGSSALLVMNPDSAADTLNTAVGYHAGRLVSTGTKNTLIGGLAGDAITTGGQNTAVGYDALGAGIATYYNTAIGYQALSSDTTGRLSVAVGRQALSSQNVTNSSNVYNTAVGTSAGSAVTTGTNNTFVGGLAGDTVTTGDYNVIVGKGSDTVTYADKANGLGSDLACSGGYTTLGYGSDDIRAYHGNVTWATVSDERYKKDIVDSEAGLSFINALQPRTFKYKTLGELPETFSAYEADSTEVFKNSNTNHGFIAQEVKAAIDADSSIKDGFRLWDDRDDGSQEVAEAALIPVLTKAIQELSAQVDALTARIETLEG